ncbi:uncharacterized protein LAJ45_06883 [Morchella importuna]|uniref:uncharacterized protein n=1 Tax=Morchella importuna TaxID=1174673 RepID=UPI001E8DA39C|nr:uncharacterized protein LAJ45_06883 [Morchella importuna]KAH8148909.1 hypothetical protein LAJ45_06883 [Morchella importuna]
MRDIQVMAADSHAPSLYSCPAEIVLAISQHLPSRLDIVNLSSVSPYFRALLSPQAFRRKLAHSLYAIQLGPIHETRDPQEWGLWMCPPTIRPYVTELVLSLNSFYGTRFSRIRYHNGLPVVQLPFRLQDFKHVDNYEGIRSLSLIFIREHQQFRGTERNLVRREMFDRAMSWIDKSCRESLAPDSLTIDGIDPVHAWQFRELEPSFRELFWRVKSLKLVVIEVYQPQSHNRAAARLRQFFQTWVLPARSAEILQILSEFYMSPYLDFTPWEGVHFKHLRELSLSKIMFSSRKGPEFVESVILSDAVSATLEKLTLTRCPILYIGLSRPGRTWATILAGFTARLRRLKMFRVEKKLGYKVLLVDGHIQGFLHVHARRRPVRNAVYLADVEALLQLWKRIGQTPRFYILN